jgi:hypothetical protein
MLQSGAIVVNSLGETLEIVEQHPSGPRRPLHP